MLFQIAIIFFALVVIMRTYGQYKKEHVSRYWLIAFSCLWAIVIIAALIPKSTDTLARFVGVERGADLFVYVAVLVLVYTVYRLLVRTQQTQQEITELVRHIALASPQIPENSDVERKGAPLE